MKLGVSNLAWTPAEDAEILALLPTMGVTGLEVAPTRIAPWEALTPAVLGAYRATAADQNLVISSMQAITYGRADIALFGDQAALDRLIDHLALVAEIGSHLGAGVAVFGAPKVRGRGGLDEASARDLALEAFSRIADRLTGSSVRLGIEPVPPAYGNDFLTSPEAVTRFVEHLDRPEIVLHLDTGCAFLGGADIAEGIALGAQRLAHFHIAEPHLAGFEAPLAHHRDAAAALKAIDYQGWTVIEMLASPDPVAAMKTALGKVAALYREVP